MCDACDIISGKIEAKVLYQDERTLAIFDNNPMSMGHITVFSKEHYPDVSKVPAEMFAHYMRVASLAATALFEGIGSQGTNIVLNNCIDGNNDYNHFCIHVLPRSEGDKIPLKWEFKQADPEKLKKLADKIKEETFFIGKDRANKDAVIDLDGSSKDNDSNDSDDDDLDDDSKVSNERKDINKNELKPELKDSDDGKSNIDSNDSSKSKSSLSDKNSKDEFKLEEESNYMIRQLRRLP